VGKRVRDNIALRLLLQAVVTDRGGGSQRLIDIPRIEEIVLLLCAVRPDPGVSVGLKLDTHLKPVHLGLA
jgi:hypothetical protein